MSLHSYSRCWLHLVWGTLRRERILPKPAAAQVSRYLSEYAQAKDIYMKINFVNADHVHALIELPTHLCIEDAVQWLKGGSSHWINSSRLLAGRFAWGRGYGSFSVSASGVSRVTSYIARQEVRHRETTFADELREFVELHGMEWREERMGEAVETAGRSRVAELPGEGYAVTRPAERATGEGKPAKPLKRLKASDGHVTGLKPGVTERRKPVRRTGVPC